MASVIIEKYSRFQAEGQEHSGLRTPRSHLTMYRQTAIMEDTVNL